MRSFHLNYGMFPNLRQWLLQHVGPIDDCWSIELGGKLTFKKDVDALYFKMMFIEKIKDNGSLSISVPDEL